MANECIICSGSLAGRRSDAQRCPKCKTQRRKHGLSARALANRDGFDCRICGVLVDFTIGAPDPRSPSVDRIIPGRLGGTNDPDNLQLAHRWCNAQKNVGVVVRGSLSTYNYEWKKFSRLMRAEQPTCAQCDAPSACVVHIVAPVDGGDIWDRSNLLVLCRPCASGHFVRGYHARCEAA